MTLYPSPSNTVNLSTEGNLLYHKGRLPLRTKEGITTTLGLHTGLPCRVTAKKERTNTEETNRKRGKRKHRPSPSPIPTGSSCNLESKL